MPCRSKTIGILDTMRLENWLVPGSATTALKQLKITSERDKGQEEMIFSYINAVVALPATSQFANLIVSKMPIVLLLQGWFKLSIVNHFLENDLETAHWKWNILNWSSKPFTISILILGSCFCHYSPLINYWTIPQAISKTLTIK